MEILARLTDRHPVETGVVGVSSSLWAIAMTLLEQLDIVVRVAGGIVGLGIGILTLAIQWRRWRKG